MAGTFVVTLREGFEAALLLGIVYAYLDRIGAHRQYHYVTTGAVLGALASVAAGVAVSLLSGPLLDLGPDLIGAGVIFVAVILLTWHGWWMRQHSRAIQGDVERRLDAARASRRLWVVAAIAFTGVFREGAESVLFLWGLFTQAGSSGWAAVTGGLSGVAGAAVLGWAVFRGGRRISMRRFFAATSALLLLLAAGLFATGVGKLQGLGFLPGGGAVWDTSRVLPDSGLIGSFLGGLVGYRARPTGLEAAGYAAYLAVAALLLFGRTSAVPSGAGSTATVDAPTEPGRALSQS